MPAGRAGYKSQMLQKLRNANAAKETVNPVAIEAEIVAARERMGRSRTTKRRRRRSGKFSRTILS